MTEAAAMPGTHTFAVVIPVGPDPVEVCRCAEVLTSLARWEPGVAWCILIDDHPEGRELSSLYALPPRSCKVLTIQNPRRGRGNGHSGGVVAGMFVALAWIQANTDAGFVMKIDTDALVIGPFVSFVTRVLSERPEAAIVGALGCSCRPDVRDIENLAATPLLLRLHRLLPIELPDEDDFLIRLAIRSGLRHEQPESLRAFAKIREHVIEAVKYGYWSDENCQGGAYVITRTLIDRMARSRYFDSADVWADMNVGDERAFAMYAHAAGLALVGLVGTNHPFGLQSTGLAYPPQISLELGHSVIHSIKNDCLYAESEIVEFFRGPRHSH